MKRKLVAPVGFAVISLFLLSACSKHEPAKQASRKTASAVEPALELGESWDSANDDQTESVVATNQRMLIARIQENPFMYRDAHPKHHGCVMASFDVDSSALAPEQRVGVFAPNAPSKYAAWVRFSNGNPDGEHSPDVDKDVRGMAIKLMNVEGSSSGSQDFVMLTSKEFFSEDGDDYVTLHNALGGKLSTVWYLATHPKQAWILHEAEKKIGNPLQGEYFSSVPYKLGTRSMKFKALPCAANDIRDEVPGSDAAPNYLRERLADTLGSKPACYDFYVQPNMDPDTNPVENPTLAWDEEVSPYVKVATVSFPQQKDITSAEHINFCENLSFNPWHTLPDTRPVGQINRMRKVIYPAISKLRHSVNHIPEIEPKSHDICTGETAPLCQTPKLR